MNFVDILPNATVAKQGTCPKCRGVGVEPNLTHYPDLCRTVVSVCSLCFGTGTVMCSGEPNEEQIKRQQFLAQYYHTVDPTKVNVTGKQKSLTNRRDTINL